jgi:hypothetical protein
LQAAFATKQSGKDVVGTVVLSPIAGGSQGFDASVNPNARKLRRNLDWLHLYHQTEKILPTQVTELGWLGKGRLQIGLTTPINSSKFQ